MIIVQWLCNVLTIVKVRGRVYRISLYYFCHFYVNLKLFQNKILKNWGKGRWIKFYIFQKKIPNIFPGGKIPKIPRITSIISIHQYGHFNLYNVCVMWDAFQHVEGSFAVDGAPNTQGEFGEMIFRVYSSHSLSRHAKSYFRCWK